MSDIAAVGEKRVFEPFDKEAFKKEILNNIKYLFRKTPETASQLVHRQRGSRPVER